MILYFFYKNMLFTIPQLFFTYLSAYSGLSVFDDWYITFYNLFFTALPLVFKAVIDQDVYYKKWVWKEGENGKKQYLVEESKNLKRIQPFLY